MVLPSGTRLGAYDIVGALRAGGMGEVYKARGTRLDRMVAIKVMTAALAGAADLRARFEQEARAIAALNHPHICTIHDVGRHGDVEFLLMELLDGETLAQRIKRGPLPIAEALGFSGTVQYMAPENSRPVRQRAFQRLSGCVEDRRRGGPSGPRNPDVAVALGAACGAHS